MAVDVLPVAMFKAKVVSGNRSGINSRSIEYTKYFWILITRVLESRLRGKVKKTFVEYNYIFNNSKETEKENIF